MEDTINSGLLIGITIGCVGFICIVLFIKWTNQELERAQEIHELHQIGRTVGMGLRTIVDTLKVDDYASSATHIRVAQQRMIRFTPTFEESMRAYDLLAQTVDHMNTVIAHSEQLNYDAAINSLLESAKTYNLFMDYVTVMIDSSKVEP